MKKKILGGIAILAIAAIAAFNVNINTQEEALSAITMDNVEALAYGELSDCQNGCYSNGDGCWCYTWYPCYREAK